VTSTATSRGGGWDPDQYARFREERTRPFTDLAALVEPHRGMQVIDLGCGGGELTAWLHGHLGAGETLGVDSSEAMLAGSSAFTGGGVRFERADITELTPESAGTFDLVFSNAALQWITEHEALFPRLLRLVRPGGQFAVQMPASSGHVSHYTAHEIAREEPYASALGGWVREDPVQEPEWYASLLHEQGATAQQRVRQEIYGHTLESTRAIVEWVKGSLLTAYQQRLPEELYGRFVADYESRLVERLGEQSPYFYTFRRVLLWARLPERER
jgi:trans-aconitate 2-methyltransferase